MKTADIPPPVDLDADITHLSRTALIELHTCLSASARAALTLFFETRDMAHMRRSRKYRDRCKAITDLLYSSPTD